MKTEYILFSAVLVVVVAFIMVFLIVIKDMKKKMVRKKIDKFNDNSTLKVTQKELDRMLSYIEKNKKHLTPSLYKESINKITKVQARI